MKVQWPLLSLLVCVWIFAGSARANDAAPCLTFFIGLHDAGQAPPATNTDGLTFRVEIISDGRTEKVFEKHWTQRAWSSEKVDLSKYADKDIKIRFVVHPGPKNDPYSDWGCWGEPKIVVGGKTVYDFVEKFASAKTGMDGKYGPLNRGAWFSLTRVPVGNLPLEPGVRLCGGEKKRGIYAEPAWDGVSAESFGEFRVRLGAAAKDDFKTLDLRKLCNRGFRDEAVEDGKGGWTDQGENDLRNFPTGRREFLEVPFDIIDPASNEGKSVVALTGDASERDVPVGQTARTVYFLHTGGWLNGVVGTYTIQYADGKSQDISIMTGDNIFDWWSPGNLPNCRLAWSGSNPARSYVGVGIFAWENPRPEEPIQSIHLKALRGVPIVLGITLSSASSVLPEYEGAKIPEQEELNRQLDELRKVRDQLRDFIRDHPEQGKVGAAGRFALNLVDMSIPGIVDDIAGLCDRRAFLRYKEVDFFRQEGKGLIEFLRAGPNAKFEAKLEAGASWYLPQARERAGWNIRYLSEFARKAMAGELPMAPVEHRYRTGPVEIRDGALYQDGRPIFLIGFCEDMSSMADLGGYTDMDLYTGLGISLLAPTHNPSRMVVTDIDPCKYDDAYLVNYLQVFLRKAEQRDLAIEFLVHADPVDAPASYLHKMDVAGMLNPATNRNPYCPYDLLSPKAKEFFQNYLGYTIPRIKSPAMFCYELFNQPHFYPNSELVKEGFRQWVKKRHGSLGNINALWKTKFASFKEIDPPDHHRKIESLGYRYDWLTYQREVVLNFYRWYKKQVNALDPGRPLTIQDVGDIMTLDMFGPEQTIWRGTEKEDEAIEIEDIMGFDAYTNYNLGGEFALSFLDMLIAMDFMKSVGPNKPIMNWEYYPTATNSRAEYPEKYFRSALWQQAIHGQVGTSIWLWQRWDDPEGKGAGDANSIPHWPIRIAGVGMTSLELAKFADQVVLFPRVSNPMAVLCSRTSKFLDASDHFGALRRLYMGLFFKGRPVRFVTERLIGEGRLDACKVLMVPNVKYLPQETFKKIIDFVRGGGIVVYTPGSFRFDEYGRTRELPPQFQGKEEVKLGKGRTLPMPANLGESEFDQWIERICEYPEVHRPVRLTGRDGKSVYGVEWQTAPAGPDKTLMFILNLKHETQVVGVTADRPVRKVRSLMTDRELRGPIEARSLTPMLLEIEYQK